MEYRIDEFRFSFFSPTCLRIEYSPEKIFPNNAPLICGKSLPKTITCHSVEKKGIVELKTEFITLNFWKNKKKFEEKIKIIFNIKGVKGKWYPGLQDNKNLGVIGRSLDNWQNLPLGFDRHEKRVLFSRSGYFSLEDNSPVFFNKKTNWPEVKRISGYRNIFFFVYGKDFTQVLQDYVTVFGKIPLLPKWAFGFWYSRWYPYREKEVLDIVKQYRKEGIPIDVFVIDTDWRENVWNGYDWNKKYFPNSKKLFKKLHNLGVKATLNDHPGYDRIDSLSSNESSIKKLSNISKEPTWKGEWGCDWSRRSVVQAFEKICFAPFFRDGLDFWWIDGWAESPFEGIDSQLWLNWSYYEMSERQRKKRGLILSRWGGYGSHRYPVQFSGDTFSNWATLRYEIYFTALSSGMGAVYWSHDIGGFHDKRIPEELFLRWVQFGVFSPIFRTHSASGIREPWNYSKKAVKVFRFYIRLRYTLIPYIYNIAREIYEKGMPIVRPLFLHYPEDVASYTYKYQYLFGRDILVAPADGPIPDGKKHFRKMVYFPADEWLDLLSRETIRGPIRKEIKISLDSIPFYIKKGAIIPTSKIDDCIKPGLTKNIYFEIFPKEKSELILYDDDGESLAYRNGKYVKQKITVEKDCTGIRIKVRKSTGKLKTLNEKQNYYFSILLEAGEKIGRVLFNGKVIDFEISNFCFSNLIKSSFRFLKFSPPNISDSFTIVINL